MPEDIFDEIAIDTSQTQTKDVFDEVSNKSDIFDTIGSAYSSFKDYLSTLSSEPLVPPLTQAGARVIGAGVSGIERTVKGIAETAEGIFDTLGGSEEDPSRDILTGLAETALGAFGTVSAPTALIPPQILEPIDKVIDVAAEYTPAYLALSKVMNDREKGLFKEALKAVIYVVATGGAGKGVKAGTKLAKDVFSQKRLNIEAQRIAEVVQEGVAEGKTPEQVLTSIKSDISEAPKEVLAEKVKAGEISSEQARDAFIGTGEANLAQIDKHVAEGKLTRQQANEMIKKSQERRAESIQQEYTGASAEAIKQIESDPTLSSKSKLLRTDLFKKSDEYDIISSELETKFSKTKKEVNSLLGEFEKADPYKQDKMMEQYPGIEKLDDAAIELHEIKNRVSPVQLKDQLSKQIELDFESNGVKVKLDKFEESGYSVKDEAGNSHSFRTTESVKDAANVVKAKQKLVESNISEVKQSVEPPPDNFPPEIKTGIEAVQNENLASDIKAVDIKVQLGDLTERLIRGTSEGKIARKETDKLYAGERARRLAKLDEALKHSKGEQAFISGLSTQKGELPKADFKPLRDSFTKEEIDVLFDAINQSSRLKSYGYDKLNAMGGLKRIFEGAVPRDFELALLEKVFGSKLVSALKMRRSTSRKTAELALDITTGFTKSLNSGYEMSVMLRQGVIPSISHPTKVPRAFIDMNKSFFSEEAYKAIERRIDESPFSQLYTDAGLDIYRYGEVTPKIHMRNEFFQSNLADRIPILRIGVQAGERAFNTYVNVLKTQIFDGYAKQYMLAGETFKANPKLFTDLADALNTEFGRTGLGKYGEKAAPILNLMFYSPRFAASRFKLLNPVYYANLSRPVRLMLLSDMSKYIGTGLAGLALAKALGTDVELDPRSTDFLKMKVGNSRVDLWSGLQPIVRSMIQLASGQYKDKSGNIREANRLETVKRFLESKRAPLAGFTIDFLRQKDMLGKKISYSKEFADLVTPMYARDLWELADEYDDPAELILSPIGFYGGGIQTYGKSKIEKDRIPKLLGLK